MAQVDNDERQMMPGEGLGKRGDTLYWDSNLLLFDFNELLVPGGVNGCSVPGAFRTICRQDVEALPENLQECHIERITILTSLALAQI